MKSDNPMPNREERWEGEGGNAEASAESTAGLHSFEQAIQKGDYEEVKALLLSGEDPNRHIYNGLHPLHIAAAHGCDATLLMIVSHGGDINIQDSEGMTPLMHAIMAKHNDIETVKDILKVPDLDLEIRNHCNETALDVATRLAKHHLVSLFPSE